ncbi:hypothetical protein [Litoribacillus peritrichatus]|uniref:Uncharacterized protein n=1 Tax=Litoribacillus peritrichatus TaxID=718191 RepID=A0ABP7MF26_9GAMM
MTPILRVIISTITAIAFYTSPIANAQLSKEKAEELSASIYLNYQVLATKLLQNQALDRYAMFAPTRKMRKARKDLLNKINPDELYIHIFDSISNHIEPEDADKLIEYGKTLAYRKLLKKQLYMATDEGYKVTKKIQAKYGLGLFEPKPELFQIINENKSCDAPDQKKFESSQIVMLHFFWLYNLEAGKAYPRFKQPAEMFKNNFQKYLQDKEKAQENCKYAQFVKYLSMESLSIEEINASNQEAEKDYIKNYSKAYHLGIINYFKTLADEPLEPTNT